MGYACPVCDAPQADGEHLANHLAFTALLGDAAHESFLDEQVPDWGSRDPQGLGAVVVELAEETDHEPVTAPAYDHGPEHSHDRDQEHSHGHGPEHGHDRGHDQRADVGSPERGAGPPADDTSGALSAGSDGSDRREAHDDETAAIVSEARELTREMYGTGVADDRSDGEGEERTDGSPDRDADGRPVDDADASGESGESGRGDGA